MKWNINQKLISRLKSGDILLFSGNSPFSSTIKLFTHSNWSHVGMVFEMKNNFFCWESDTTIKKRTAQRSGVRMIELMEKINGYEGEISVRQLISLSKEQKQTMHAALTKFSKIVKDKPYEKSISELIRSAYDGPLGENLEDLSSIFCSELIAAAYQHAGLLPDCPPGLPSNEYTPADFSRNIILLKGKFSIITPIKTKKELPVVSETHIIA